MAPYKEQVILVDKNDQKIGIGEKIKTHREGKLHRSFSTFVFNSKGKLLLQKRAKTKYHSGGLWSNTCCSHPRHRESVEEAAHRKLKQEMGFDCELKKVSSFIYKVRFDNGLSEHEYDHIFMGKFDGNALPNPEEVEDWKWVKINELKKDIEKNPDIYTYWLRVSIDKMISYLKK